MRRVKTYKFSRQALTRRREVRSVSLSDRDQSRSYSPDQGKVRLTDACSNSPSSTESGRAGRDKPSYSSTNASPKSKTPKMCYSCNQPGRFKRECPNLTRSAESLSPSPRPRTPPFTSDKKLVQFPDQPITMTRLFVPSVRAGAQERRENACHIPVSTNGVVVDAVVTPQPKLPSFR